MDFYNLMTLNPQEMMKHYDVVKLSSGNYAISYCYDFSESSFIDNLIVSGIDSFDENALLYQLEKVARKSDDVSWNENSLMQHILYIDFTEVFKNIKFNEESKQYYTQDELSPKKASDDTKLSFMFDPESGIRITFKDGNQRIFVPFDKSNSMARTCRITFIDKGIKDELDKRLLLGFDFNKIDLVLSKYYAYRGLYLTSAHRVPLDKQLVLNEETVIVIPDDSNYVLARNAEGIPAKHTIFKDIDTKVDNGILWKLGEVKESSVKINPFDGEGLVSLKYAGLINERLGKYGYKKKKLTDDGEKIKGASTYQIRMPFTKGVLHSVDFNSFISEYVTEENSVMITDVFGIQRDIRKAEIILTESMFKCFKWIKNIWQKEGHSLTREDDLMKFYFGQMHKYDHSLYVGNTDLSLSNVNVIKMNYQFLNTLDMPAEDFDSLIMKHSSQAGNVRELFLRDADDMSEDATEDSRVSVWQKALSKNMSLLDDVKIKGLIKGTEETLMVDCAGGKIRVDGECRFLSCDLLALVLFIVRKLNVPKKAKQTCKKMTALFEDKFFMPGARIPLSPDRYYGILRNPHLSRNEQAALMPYIAKKGSVYDRYFSHLTGVIMLSRNSLVPNTLSGADFDGDLVKIVSQPEIVNAIKRGAYTENSESKRITRKLSIIEIPKTLATAESDSGTIPYRIIKNTFSNSIGQISNLAIKIGKKEYFEKNPAFANKCAECTVVTGLEIDAAKTGVHPTKNISALREVLKHHGETASDKDYFLNISEMMASLGRDKFSVKIERSGKNFKVKKSRGKKALLSIIPYQVSDNAANIDRLPYYYVMEKLQQAEKKKDDTVDKKTSKAQKVFFRFQVDDSEWKKKLNKELLDETKQLIIAYLSVLKLASRIYQYKRKFAESKFSRCVLTILRIQYDSLDSELPCGIPVSNALDSTYSYLDEKLIEPSDAQNALKHMIDNRWQYTGDTERVKMLKEILSISEDAIPIEVNELLSNFDNSGYNLLYFILQHIISEKLKNFTPELYEERQIIKGETDDATLLNNQYYKVLHHIYFTAANRGEQKNVWHKKIIRCCQSYLRELFAEDMDYAIKYVFANRSTDKSATFFWDVLPERTILDNVYDNPWRGGKKGAE